MVFVDTFVSYASLILPWYAVGVVLAYFAEQQLKPKWIEHNFGKVSWEKLIVAQVLGMVSPLSIMSFLPVARELVGLGFNSGLL
jgi:uncharacterized membrane protein YraQ (UPF0718 family)